MANCLPWFHSRILKVIIFYCEKTKYKVLFFCLPYSGTWVHKRVRVKFKVPEYGSRFPSTDFEKNNWNYLIFANLFKNVLSFTFGLILDAVKVCHVVWVIGFGSGLKKIDFGRRCWVEKLAQYRWLVRYSLLLGFIMSKNPKGLWFYILIESSVCNLSCFFDMIKPRRKEYLPSQ